MKLSDLSRLGPRLPVALALAWLYSAPWCAPATAATESPSTPTKSTGGRYAPTPASSSQRPPGLPKQSPPATTLAPSPPGISGRALEHAASLHGAIALRDWPAATETAQALRRLLTEWVDDSPANVPLRGQLLDQLAAVPRLEQSIQNRQLRNANEEAHTLMQALLALGELTPGSTGGGGGGATFAGVAEQQLRQGYRAVVSAHAFLLRGEIRSAKTQLEQVRQALTAALQAKPGAIFTKRLEDLNQRRWRVLAHIENPAEARRYSRELARAYARAIYAVGNYAASLEVRQSPPPRRRFRHQN